VNNTCLDCSLAFRVWDETIRGAGVACRNNLVLNASYPDSVWMDSGGKPDRARGMGDGKQITERWTFSHNWREVSPPSKPPEKGDGWIPPGPKDVRKERIEGIARDPQSPRFMRPTRDAVLSDEGAGREDPSLPIYVGALPPEGVAAWDWNRTWRMPKDTQLLTVSKDSKDNAKYKTINAALKDAKPWATIRVLDAATYEEWIDLREPENLTGLWLDGPRGATINIPTLQRVAVAIHDVPFVRVSGFQLRDPDEKKDPSRIFVSVSGKAAGVTISGLDIKTKGHAVGISVNNATATNLNPVRVERNWIRTQNDGIFVGGTSQTEGSRWVMASGNVITAGATRGIFVQGVVADILVAGNRLSGCGQAGVQVTDLVPRAGRILFVNNTSRTSGTGFRYWESEGQGGPKSGQVQLMNNLFLEATHVDVGYFKGGVGRYSPGPGKLLLERWYWRGNARDLSGAGLELAEFLVPLAPGDRRVTPADLAPRVPGQDDLVRARKGTPPENDGGGPSGRGLPRYPGAMSPEGIPAWDWDITWASRMSPRP
jgi:hypothetical protein